MISSITWEPRESYIFHQDVLEGAIFDSLPREGSWNICNKIIYNDKKYKLYLQLIQEEDEPRVYTKTGTYTFINNVWNEIRTAIIYDKTSEYLME